MKVIEYWNACSGRNLKIPFASKAEAEAYVKKHSGGVARATLVVYETAKEFDEVNDPEYKKKLLENMPAAAKQALGLEQ